MRRCSGRNYHELRSRIGSPAGRDGFRQSISASALLRPPLALAPVPDAEANGTITPQAPERLAVAPTAVV